MKLTEKLPFLTKIRNFDYIELIRKTSPRERLSGVAVLTILIMYFEKNIGL